MPIPLDPVLLVIYALALASVTRLVVGTDTLTGRANDWTVGLIEAVGDWSAEYFDDRPGTSGWVAIKLIRGVCWFLAKMITCAWCASFWLAVIMLCNAGHWRSPVWLFFALALAFRQFVGMTSSMGR